MTMDSAILRRLKATATTSLSNGGLQPPLLVKDIEEALDDLREREQVLLDLAEYLGCAMLGELRDIE